MPPSICMNAFALLTSHLRHGGVSKECQAQGHIELGSGALAMSAVGGADCVASGRVSVRQMLYASHPCLGGSEFSSSPALQPAASKEPCVNWNFCILLRPSPAP